MGRVNDEYMVLVEKIRKTLRIKTADFDDEIMMLIEACKIDLNMAGVSVVKTDDPSFVRAVSLYCKANFGYSDDSTKWNECYKALRDSMALSKEYGVVQNPETDEAETEPEPEGPPPEDPLWWKKLGESNDAV